MTCSATALLAWMEIRTDLHRSKHYRRENTDLDIAWFVSQPLMSTCLARWVGKLASATATMGSSRAPLTSCSRSTWNGFPCRQALGDAGLLEAQGWSVCHVDMYH